MNTMEITINKIYKNDKDKNGNLLKTKDGKLYTRLAIQTSEYGSKWISGFLGDWNKDWKVGDKVQLVVEQKGEYLNFSKLTEIDLLNLRMDKVEKEINELKKFILSPTDEPEKPVNEKFLEETGDEIPF